MDKQKLQDNNDRLETENENLKEEIEDWKDRYIQWQRELEEKDEEIEELEEKINELEYRGVDYNNIIESISSDLLEMYSIGENSREIGIFKYKRVFINLK